MSFWTYNGIKRTAADVTHLPNVVKAQTITGHRFRNILFLWEALQAPGSAVDSIDGRPLVRGNMRIAIVGDAVLTAVLSQEWFSFDKHAQMGYWQTEWRNRLLSDERLAELAKDIDLTSCLCKKPMQPDQTVPGMKQSASLFEAVAGAIYLDADHDTNAVKKFIEKVGLLAEGRLGSAAVMLGLAEN